MRTDVRSDDPVARAAAENKVSGALANLFAVSENYPDLKADGNFLELQRELSALEDTIQKARRYYNGAVRTFNTTVESFPSVIIANMFGFVKADFFEIDDDAQRAVTEVDFMSARLSLFGDWLGRTRDHVLTLMALVFALVWFAWPAARRPRTSAVNTSTAMTSALTSEPTAASPSKKASASLCWATSSSAASTGISRCPASRAGSRRTPIAAWRPSAMVRRRTLPALNTPVGVTGFILVRKTCF